MPLARRAAVSCTGPSQPRDDTGRRGKDQDVGRDTVASRGAHVPAGPRQLHLVGALAEPDRVAGQRGEERVHERRHAAREAPERPAVRGAPPLPAQCQQHAAAGALHGHQLRQDGFCRQPRDVARVDAAQQRLRDALRGLGAEPAAEEGRHAFVATRPPPRDHRLQQHPRLAAVA